MSHVQEIFDGSWPAGVKVIGTAMDFVESGVIPLWEWGDIPCRITERYPYPIILLLSMVDFYMRRRRWFLVGMSGNADTLPCFVIGPAMVWTNKRLVLYSPQGESGATMQTEVAPRVHFIADAPEHNIFF